MKNLLLAFVLMLPALLLAESDVVISLDSLVAHSDLIAIIDVDLSSGSPVGNVQALLKGSKTKLLSIPEPYRRALENGKYLVFLTKTETGFKFPAFASLFPIAGNSLYWPYTGERHPDRFEFDAGLKIDLQKGIDMVGVIVNNHLKEDLNKKTK